jgi:hypothetical protein
MPALINIAVNLAFGASLAWTLRRSPALREELFAWPLLLLLAFEALVFTPVATYLFRFYPQWSMLYWFDPQVFPGLDAWTGVLSFLAILLNFAAVLGGYMLVRASLLRPQTWLRYVPFACAAGLSLLVFALYGRRVVFIGDYDEFWQGTAHFLFAGLAGWIGLLCYASTFGLVWWVGQRFSHHEPRFI